LQIKACGRKKTRGVHFHAVLLKKIFQRKKVDIISFSQKVTFLKAKQFAKAPIDRSITNNAEF
jgi:hypothetical protein